jgi:hypothetical protein
MKGFTKGVAKGVTKGFTRRYGRRYVRCYEGLREALRKALRKALWRASRRASRRACGLSYFGRSYWVSPCHFPPSRLLSVARCLCPGFAFKPLLDTECLSLHRTLKRMTTKGLFHQSISPLDVAIPPQFHLAVQSTPPPATQHHAH